MVRGKGTDLFVCFGRSGQKINLSPLFLLVLIGQLLISGRCSTGSNDLQILGVGNEPNYGASN
jgi:hypothetical protein